MDGKEYSHHKFEDNGGNWVNVTVNGGDGCELRVLAVGGGGNVDAVSISEGDECRCGHMFY